MSAALSAVYHIYPNKVSGGEGKCGVNDSVERSDFETPLLTDC